MKSPQVSEPNISALQHRAESGHRDVSVGELGAEGVVALEDQRVVVGGDVRVGNGDFGGGDDVPAVLVAGGVDGEVVGDDVVAVDVVAVVGQCGEVAAAAQGDAAEGQVLQRVSEMVLSASPASGFLVAVTR